ncbi:MAG: CoA pyrophosphatase [Planctomycetales bacterium]|nr:CoA pyrophosphatase [Planctomycetales bacterium]
MSGGELLDPWDYAQLRARLVDSLADPTRLVQRAQRRAALSPELSYGRHFGPPSPLARRAAVMLLLEPRDGQWTIPLTVRPDHLPDHPGQISLPGGGLEGPESYRQAAVREFGEELGCIPFPGEILGELLPLYVYGSDYYVMPFVSICSGPLQYVPCPYEVQRLVHLPLRYLLDPHSLRRQQFSRGSTRWTAPLFEYQGAVVWGATAIILSELSALLA